MKNLILGILVGVALGGLATWTLLKHHDEKEAEKHEEKKEESRVQHGTNGEVFIKLDKEAQEHCGLKLAVLEQIETRPEIKAFGRVLDPSMLAMQLVDINTTKAALEASRKEYERLPRPCRQSGSAELRPYLRRDDQDHAERGDVGPPRTLAAAPETLDRTTISRPSPLPGPPD